MALVNDGNIPYGSYQVTIGSTLYTAEDIRYSRPTFKIERRNQLNQASGFVLDDSDFPTGSMTVQRPTTTDPVLTAGLTVLFPSAAPVDTGTTYVTGEIGVTLTRGDVQKTSVTFHKFVV